MLNENLKNVNDWTFQYRKKKKKNQSRFDETNIGFLFSCKSEKQKKTVFGFIQ